MDSCCGELNWYSSQYWFARENRDEIFPSVPSVIIVIWIYLCLCNLLYSLYHNAWWLLVYFANERVSEQANKRGIAIQWTWKRKVWWEGFITLHFITSKLSWWHIIRAPVMKIISIDSSSLRCKVSKTNVI